MTHRSGCAGFKGIGSRGRERIGRCEGGESDREKKEEMHGGLCLCLFRNWFWLTVLVE